MRVATGDKGIYAAHPIGTTEDLRSQHGKQPTREMTWRSWILPGLGVMALLLTGCNRAAPPVTEAAAAAAVPKSFTKDMIDLGSANPDELVSVSGKGAAPTGPVSLTADSIIVENSMATALSFALPEGLHLPAALKIALETTFGEATGKEGFTLNLVEIPTEGGALKLLEDAGDNPPGLLLVPHNIAKSLADKRLVRNFALADSMYLSAPGAKTSDTAKVESASSADSPGIERLPDDYFDPKRSPVETASVAEPSQGTYAPLLYTALGLAAPAAETAKLDNWSTLFGPASGTAPRLVPGLGTPAVFWAALLSQRKSPNSVAPVEFKAAENLISRASSGFVAMPAGYPVTEALSQGVASLALTWGSDLKMSAFAAGKVKFEIPREGSVRLAYDLVIPKKAAEDKTALIFMALLWRPALTADLAHALRMTPALNPAARKLLAEKGAPIICLLPETRQYYEGENSQEQKTVRLEAEKLLGAALKAHAFALPEIQPAPADDAAALTPEIQPEALPAQMGPPPEIEITPGAESATEPPTPPVPAGETPTPAAEEPKASGESKPSASNPPEDASTSITLPGPDEMPAPETDSEPKT